MSTSPARAAVVLGCLLLLLVGCAAGPNELAGGDAGDAGFWLGLWHGLIVPVTFVISLFTEDVNVYEVANSGGWYDFGFLLGLMFVFSGPARAGASAPRRRARG